MTDGGFRTTVDGDVVVVRLPDPDGAAGKVTLWSDVELGDTTFEQVDGGWELRLPDLSVDCLEYLVEVDGAMQPDPTNPGTVPGPFGVHSWVALPAYRPPAWLETPPVVGTRQDLRCAETPVGEIAVSVWSPADAEAAAEPLPLLCSHDGPEMAAFGGLLHYVGAQVAAGVLPPMRVALLAPGDRNRRYAADPAYARALTGHVLPALRAACPSAHRPVLLGQSLGALAALHASWTSPESFAGLVLQSGSFFTPELDPQESGFEFWDEVTGFVASVLAASTAAPGAPAVAMTCGSAEENLADNLLMRDHLRRTGLDVSWGETRQGHTWTCWRDLLDPHLTDLLHKVWP